ncbi:unnamed protein product [Tuwongella immobilis]|uniref:Uncharacterized protein n=1 Tax=Tuwongella immobilis TaxID=692036 RepID=A0A6C2YI36_9BACT|nr:unnamed protein product [Tuwongella immobilis]VTR97024.1 unnamed protein product [Tuwongella immobilis]
MTCRPLFTTPDVLQNLGDIVGIIEIEVRKRSGGTPARPGTPHLCGSLLFSGLQPRFLTSERSNRHPSKRADGRGRLGLCRKLRQRIGQRIGIPRKRPQRQRLDGRHNKRLRGIDSKYRLRRQWEFIERNRIGERVYGDARQRRSRKRIGEFERERVGIKRRRLCGDARQRRSRKRICKRERFGA